LAGSLGISGKNVTIEYLLPNQTNSAHIVTTNASGGFSDSFAPTLAGSWQVRSSFAGDQSYGRSLSDIQFFEAVWSSLSCSVSPSSMTFGSGTVAVSGSLLAGSVGVSGRNVSITYHVEGLSDVVDNVVTGASGGYNDTFRPSIGGNWTVEAIFAGDAIYTGITSPVQSLYVATAHTTLSCSINSQSIILGQKINTFGSLLVGSFGIYNRTIAITYHVAGQLDIVDLVVTSSTGGYTDTFLPGFAGNWTVSAAFMGDASYAGSNATSRQFSAAMVSVLCSVSPSSVSVGQNVSISGSLHAGSQVLSYRNVTIEYILPGQAYAEQTLITNVSGLFSSNFAPSLGGTWQVIAVFQGDQLYAGSSSELQTFDAFWS
jgi:hypothetical protein